MMIERIRKLRNCLWLTELNRVAGMTPGSIRELLKIWPDLDSLAGLSANQITEAVQGPPDKINRLRSKLRDKNWLERLDIQAKDAAAQGIFASFSGDQDFPSRLKEISSCPIALYIRGEHFSEIMSSGFFVTVIGTRSPTAYGRMITEKITTDLVRKDVVIISGLARGIDAVAHRSALKAKGPTIAVVGNGPDIPYPPEHLELMEEIAASGLIISEHPPGTPPRKQNFPARNRILSGLADAVAVIEASVNSGTMITAGFAGDQGRDVFAVPGSILSPFSQGCNHLIRDGAEVLESADDLLWRLPLGWMQSRLENLIRREYQQIEDQEESAKNCRRLMLHTLAGNPLTLAEITQQTAMTISEAAILLTSLEIEGMLQCERGRYSLTRRAISSI